MTTRLGFMLGAIAGAALAMPLAARDEPAPKPGHEVHGAPAHGGNHAAEAPATPAIGYQGCAYFDEVGYRGRRGDARAGSSIEWLGAAWDNRISAVACAPGCRLLGYDIINFGGARRSFSGGTADVGEAWNNRISAVRVICAGDAPLIHQGH